MTISCSLYLFLLVFVKRRDAFSRNLHSYLYLGSNRFKSPVNYCPAVISSPLQLQLTPRGDELTKLINGDINVIRFPRSNDSLFIESLIYPDAFPFDITMEASINAQPANITKDLLKGVNFEDVFQGMFDVMQISEEISKDVTDSIAVMQYLAIRDLAAQNLQVRITLVKSTKCPKWHEDNVRYRLLKTYQGVGTQWVHPGIAWIRLVNFVRRDILGGDATVFPTQLINTEQPGNTLVLRGKKFGANASAVPVLHRSPECSELEPRLLLTVSIQ